MSAIKLGAWGLGRIGWVHVVNFAAQTDLYKVVAGCDVEQPKVDKLVSDYGCAGYTNAEDLLADPNVELVIIATRSMTHVPNALQALAAGKYVLLEKPIAMSTNEIELLRQADRNYPGKLFFLHNHRFEPAIQQIFGIVRSGILGDVFEVKLCRRHCFSRRADWQAYMRYGGGQLNNWGSHAIDHAVQFMGGPAKDIWSNLKGINSIGDADTHVKVCLTGENGIVVDVEISNNVALPADFCTVYGSRGSLICPDEKHIRLRYLDPGFEFPEAKASTDSPPLNGGHWADTELPWRDETQAVEPDTNMWVYVEIQTAQHLYRAIREGVPFPVANADALEVSRIIQVVKAQNPEFKWEFWPQCTGSESMRPSFLQLPSPYLAAIIEAATPDKTIASILKCEHDGAQAFMVNLAGWERDQLTLEQLSRVFHCTGRPMMPLCYRSGNLAADKVDDDARAELMLLTVEAGAAACDIMGDMYDPAPRERTRDPQAIEKQKRLIDRIHARGAEVLMSSHATNEFLTAEEILEHLSDFVARGADIPKIVVRADNEDEVVEAFRTTVLLKRELKVPFVHLCSGRFGRLQRYVAPSLGAALTFGMESTVQGPQPLVISAKSVLHELNWHVERRQGE